MHGNHRQGTPGRTATLLGIATLVALWGVMAEAAPPKITQAVWSDKTATLAVKGAASGAVEIFDLNGRRLGAGTGAFSLSLARADLLDIPCAVRVAGSAGEAVKPVAGAPKACAKAPTCTIVSPQDGARLAAGKGAHFEANASSADKSAQPLKYEWDFAGGAAARPTTLKADNIRFERNDSTYRVRFVATDAKGRRCEDAVNVEVGTPPVAPTTVAALADAAARSAPKRGSELDGKANDLVVLPFEEWSMTHDGDMRSLPRETLNKSVFRGRGHEQTESPHDSRRAGR